MKNIENNTINVAVLTTNQIVEKWGVFAIIIFEY